MLLFGCTRKLDMSPKASSSRSKCLSSLPERASQSVSTSVTLDCQWEESANIVVSSSVVIFYLISVSNKHAVVIARNVCKVNQYPTYFRISSVPFKSTRPSTSTPDQPSNSQPYIPDPLK